MRDRVLRDVFLERSRQDGLIREGVIPHDLASRGVPAGIKLGVCLEEVGEVAKALNEQDSKERLREEIIQTAACYVAWAESLT